MIKFCPNCGHPVSHVIPQDDTRVRAVCDACQTIHYENPRTVVGTIPLWNDQILLCKRAIEPRLGYWTLPAGFLENGESAQDGAVRETQEEAGASVTNLKLYSMIDVIPANQIHLFYLAEMASPEFQSGIESLETRLFSEHEIPWDDVAFMTVQITLESFLRDRQNYQTQSSISKNFEHFPLRTESLYHRRIPQARTQNT